MIRWRLFSAAAIVLAVVSAAGLAGAGSAGTRPNFSGEWMLDRQASKTNQGAPMDYTRMVMTITQSDDNNLTISREISSLKLGTRHYKYEVPIDGQVHDFASKGRTHQITASWDGPALVISIVRTREKGGSETVVRRMTLSSDGQTINCEATISTKSGEAPVSGGEVYRKL
jgi:hypothetical protein